MTQTAAISELALRHLIGMGVPVCVKVVGVPQGFRIDVSGTAGGLSQSTLQTVRGSTRRFASIDTAGAFLRSLGIYVFEVEMSGYEPGRLRKARPDRALALRNTRTAPKQQELV